MGWFTEPNIKTKKDLVDKLKCDYKNNFISSSVKDDHVWMLYQKDGITSVVCYLTEENNDELSYKTIPIESHPYKYDIPKSWINKITDVDDRENGYQMEMLKTWLNSVRNRNNMKIKKYYYPELNNVMEYEGTVEKMNYLIATDPHYGDDVWCRYEKKFDKETDWKVKILIQNLDYYEKYNNSSIHIDGVEFTMLLKNSDIPLIDKLINIKNNELFYSKGFEKKETTIGMDTAQVALGINEYAKEIKDYYKDYDNDSLDLGGYRPYFSLETLTDGVFGDVSEFTYQDKIYAIKINGWLDGDTKYDANSLLDYLEERFQIKNLEKVFDSNDNLKDDDLSYE